MKNKEKFAKELIELALSDEPVALSNGVPTSCCRITSCRTNCDFGREASEIAKCREKLREWAELEYVEPRYETDWASVPVDTPVIVKGAADNRRYFDALMPDGKLALFAAGRTSWTSNEAIRSIFHSRPNVVLAREEDRLKYRKRVDSCSGCFGAANEDCSKCKNN